MLNLTPAASWAALFIAIGLVGCVWYLLIGSSRRWGR
jgi:hypothetical protein